MEPEKIASVTVYSQPGCQACRATTRFFTTAGVPVEELQIADYPHLSTMLINKKQTAMPYVVVNDGEDNTLDSWSGLKQTRIDHWIHQWKEKNA